MKITDVNFTNLLIVLLVVGTVLNLFLPLSILYLGYVIKKTMGKDTIEKYIKAVELGICASLAFSEIISPKERKILALDIAKKILSSNNIRIRPKNEALLEDLIDAIFFKFSEQQAQEVSFLKKNESLVK